MDSERIRPHLHQSSLTMEVRRHGEMEYLVFPALEQAGCVAHLFSTRLGGVSIGDCASMNLSFTRGDAPEAVAENYRRITAALGTTPERTVASRQTHTTNIRYVTEADAGKGVVRPADYANVDGLMTDVSDLALATFYADCVPLYFVDPVHRAIGLAHSGWRGTAADMAGTMVAAMHDRFGTKPAELVTAIGPSICRECYEVGEDVAEVFLQAYPGTDVVTPGCRDGKYQLDLWLANRLNLLRAGVPAEHITVTDICTCHNPDYLFSHRASHGKRGNLGAFLMLKRG